MWSKHQNWTVNLTETKLYSVFPLRFCINSLWNRSKKRMTGLKFKFNFVRVIKAAIWRTRLGKTKFRPHQIKGTGYTNNYKNRLTIIGLKSKLFWKWTFSSAFHESKFPLHSCSWKISKDSGVWDAHPCSISKNFFLLEGEKLIILTRHFEQKQLILYSNWLP